MNSNSSSKIILFFILLYGCFFVSLNKVYAADITWTGTTSTNWATGTNWSTGTVPTSADNVTIPDASITTNDPSISAGAVCNNLTINASGVLNGNAQTISVYGNWTNNGTFNHGDGKVIFTTEFNATFIPGSSEYNNIELVKPQYGHNYLTVSGTATVVGDFTQTGGVLANGQINLQGNYIVGAISGGSADDQTSTVVNFNGTGDQAVIYSPGGSAATVQIDKISGNFTISNDVIFNGWKYVQGVVVGLDTHPLIFGDDANGVFVPGSFVYNDIIVNKTAGHNYIVTSGTATVAGNLTHRAGVMGDGQINLTNGNYIVESGALGAPDDRISTVINFNGMGDQTVVYSPGGIAAGVRIDKTSGSFILSDDVIFNSWTYVQGTVVGLDTHPLILGDDSSGYFTPGSFVYNDIEISKYSYHNYLYISGTATVAGNFTHNAGVLAFGQINLAGNYIIASTAGGAPNDRNSTIINFNGLVNQLIVYSTGGIGAQVRIDKTSGILSITNDINLIGWTYVQGTVDGISLHTLTFGGISYGSFTPGNLVYGGIEINKTNHSGSWDDLTVAAGGCIINGNLTITEGHLHLDVNNPSINVSGNVSIAADGFLYAGTSPITVNGNWTNSGTFNHGNGTIVFSGNNTAAYVFIPGSSVYCNIEVNRTNSDKNYEVLTISGTATVSGNLNHIDGRLKGGQIDLAGNYIIGAAASGTLDDYVSTVVNFNGNVNQTVSGNSSGVGAHININKTGGTLSLISNISISGWTYIAGTIDGLDVYTLTFSGKGAETFVPGNVTYGNITLNNIGASKYDVLTISGTATVSGNLNHIDGRLKGGQIDLAGNYIIGAAASGSLDDYVSTIVNFNHATNNQTVTCALNGVGAHIKINKTGGTFSLLENTAVSGWTYVQGTVNGLDAYTLIFGGKGLVVFNPGSINYGNIEINDAGAGIYDTITVSGILNISGNLTLIDGRLNLSTSNPFVNLSGNLDIGFLAGYIKGTNPITFTGTVPSTYTDNSTTPQNIGKVIINKTNADTSQNTLTLASNMACDTLNINTDNALNLGNGGYALTLNNAGAIPDVLTISGTLESGNGTVKFNTTNSAGNINLSSAYYNHLELLGNETYLLTNNTNINGNLTINSTSTLDTSTYDINLTGNLSNSGTFNPNTNTITLNGSSQSLSGSTTFYNLTKTITNSDTLSFQAGSTTTIANNLTLKGNNRDNRLSLRSLTTNTSWNLNLNEAATYDFDFLNVQDSAANRTLTVLNSIDAGNNINWQITNNTAPSSTVPTITIDGSIITVSTTIHDIDQDSISLKVEYSQDNGSTWHDPYLLSATSDLNNANTYQITNIPTLTDNHLVFTWDTKDERNELGTIMLSDTLKIRITPYDNSDLGSIQTSTSFSVNNHSAAFIPPAKPNLSSLTITNQNNTLAFTNLPNNITQIALSQTEDFSNSSFQDITLPIPTTSTLYLKFRTSQGATSDTIIYNPISQATNTLIQEGDIVKTESSFDVYIIKYNNNKQYKRLILSPNVFNSYQHLKWENIKTISEEQINQYQTSDLVKVQNDNNIYQLTPNGDQGTKKIVAAYNNGIITLIQDGTTIDIDSIYEINEVDRESYVLGE